MSNTTQALSRIEAILDDSSFVEIGAGVTARSTDFNIQEKEALHPMVLLQDTELLMVILCMYTARMQLFLMVLSVRCMLRRFQHFMIML